MSIARALALSALFLAAPVLARDMNTEERLGDFDQLVSTVRSRYACIAYKKELLGVDFEKLVPAYRARVQACPNDDAFYDLLAAFVSEMQDGHAGVYRPSKRRAKLGFDVRRVENKAVITAIDRKVLAESVFPFKVGDEVVALDGKPVARLLPELVAQHGNGNEASTLASATGRLTYRGGSFGSVPTGIVKLDIKPRGKDEIQSVMTPWLVKGAAMPGLSFHGKGDNDNVLPDSLPGALSMNPLAASLAEERSRGMAPEGSSAIESKVFEAHMFDTPKGPMGYIKIPDFTPDDTEEAAKEMRRLLGEMRFTRGLVLDLSGNPGGYITYCHGLASMFMSKPLEVPTVSLKASRTVLSKYIGHSQAADADPMFVQLAKISADLLRAALEKDQPMTEYGYPYGFSAAAPEALYTKPILLLIDEESFSCGDIFPALMQDNKRATLFGHTTGGGGGAVENFGPLANSGATMSLTVNLMKRTNGTFIENHGVSPDIAYEHTQQDVADGFKAYRQAYVKALLEIVP